MTQQQLAAGNRLQQEMDELSAAHEGFLTESRELTKHQGGSYMKFDHGQEFFVPRKISKAVCQHAMRLLEAEIGKKEQEFIKL